MTPVSMYVQLPILLVIISMVYSATRHDDWSDIFLEAFRWGTRMLGFMLTIGVVMFALAWLAG